MIPVGIALALSSFRVRCLLLLAVSLAWILAFWTGVAWVVLG